MGLSGQFNIHVSFSPFFSYSSKMKGMSRHSHMAKMRSPRKHHKWKHGGARQRAGIGSGLHSRDWKPEAPPVVHVDPLSALVHSDSGKLNGEIIQVKGTCTQKKRESHANIIFVALCGKCQSIKYERMANSSTELGGSTATLPK